MDKHVLIGVSTKADGNMGEGWGDRETVRKNRNIFLNKLGINPDDLVLTSLEGKDWIEMVGIGDKGRKVEGDGLITTHKLVGLWIVIGDCFPVVLFDPDSGILALAHIGYSGADLRLAEKSVRKMAGLGANPKSIEVWIGPGIRKESYILDAEMVFQKNDPLWRPFLADNGPKISVDIPGYIKRQLADNQVNSAKIEDCGIDTGKDTSYFSHYRSKRTGETEGRFGVVTMMK